MPTSAAVREMPATSKTLYEIEDDLLALLDSEEGVPAELEAEFREDLAKALVASREKRERVARSILQDEAEAAFARGEVQRIQKWARARESRAERKRAYALGVIQAMGNDDKGKPRKLEGLTVTMSARTCPASLEIKDRREIPVEYKRVGIDIRGDTWLRILPLLPPDLAGEAFLNMRETITDYAVKKDIEDGWEIPGADLAIGKLSLVVK